MKLNEKGEALAEYWDGIWDKAIELDKSEKGEENAEGGWSVICEHGFVNCAADLIGVLLVANGDEALNEELLLMRENEAAMPWAYETNCKQFIDMMLPFFDMSDEERERVSKYFTCRVKVRKHVKGVQ